MTEPLAVLVLTLTALVFAVLIPFASHRSYLLLQSRRSRSEVREPLAEADLPVVTVQLPMYNERMVAARAVDAACVLDYPRDRLEIQVLDDSTDATSFIVEQRVAFWQAHGIDIRHVRRDDRVGFKAGALAYGTERARGDFLLVLDADFLPPTDLIRDLLPPMQDRGVGMVQAAWDHLNREVSWLTKAQTYLLDGHFLFEQGGRYAARRFFNFNGTAGLWRRRCLEEAGGWQSDTLTEDLDLSYRAQMAGWRFAYLDDVRVPAEIPETVTALEVQQRRWAQGGVQTGRKILPTLLRGDFSPGVKVEAVIHLMGHVAHPLTLALAILLFPSAVARRSLGLESLLGLDVLLFGAATVPFAVFYWLAGERRGRPRKGRVRDVLRTLALGIGLSAPVSRAVARGFRGADDPFVRTPKRGVGRGSVYQAMVVPFDTVAKLAMGTLMLVYLGLAVDGGYWGQIPFIVLFLSGYLGLGLPAVRDRLLGETAIGVDGEDGEEGHPERGPRQRGLGPFAGLLIPRQAEVADECEAA
ncbi:MAG: glycosyltransferase [Gemmatimonadetes bacterium]|nr:glycosyltransferase [Gemmatimonadota bacterium]